MFLLSNVLSTLGTLILHNILAGYVYSAIPAELYFPFAWIGTWERTGVSSFISRWGFLGHFLWSFMDWRLKTAHITLENHTSLGCILMPSICPDPTKITVPSTDCVQNPIFPSLPRAPNCPRFPLPSTAASLCFVVLLLIFWIAAETAFFSNVSDEWSVL